MELLERIYLDRTSDPGRLGAAERERARREPRLKAALADNALLRPPSAPAPPGLDETLAAAYGRAEAGPRELTALWRRARLAPKPLPLRLGWQLAGLAILLGVLAALLIPHGPSWAEMDGYVLRYPVLYPGYANVSWFMNVASPPGQLIQAVDAWAAEHKSAAPPGWNGAVAYATTGRSSYAGDWVRQHTKLPCVQAVIIEVTLYSGDAQDLASLRQALEGIPHVFPPEVLSQRWVYSKEQAALFSKRYTVVLDGKRYNFPTDFTPEEAEALDSWMSELRPEQPMVGTFFRLKKVSKLNLGTLTRVELGKDGVYTLTTVTREPLFADLEIPDWYDLMTTDNSDILPPEKSFRRIHEQVAKSAANKQQEFVELKGWGIAIPLLPPERWEGALNGTLPADLSAEEKALTAARYEELKKLFDTWQSEHAGELALVQKRSAALAYPEAHYYHLIEEPKGYFRADPSNMADMAFVAELRGASPGLRDSLIAYLRQAKLVHEPLTWELYPFKYAREDYVPPAKP